MKVNNLLEDNINNDNQLEINNNIMDDNLNNANVPLFGQEEDILKSNQILNEVNKDDNYGTDSDIDDPKYMPSGNVIDNDVVELPNSNIENQNKSAILLKEKVMALQNDANLVNQTMKELENQNAIFHLIIPKMIFSCSSF